MLDLPPSFTDSNQKSEEPGISYEDIDSRKPPGRRASADFDPDEVLEKPGKLEP
jgi:hypothetical protein